jgi:diguanylate cyclase (GGDEF)-like protein
MINDSLGHDVGDELLKSVANRLETKLRDSDIIARTGGDEFIVVIEGEKALKNLDKICLQILSLFEQSFHTQYGEFKTSISIGVSQFPADSKDVRELISFADIAMYKIKKSGGNHYSFFDVKEKSFIQQRLELESEIFQAIEKNQFEVWYQPQINTETYEVYGVECLIRWNHPEQGLIAPDLFIPIAEANGSIKELGYFVLKTACHQLRQWRINNVFTGVMAINVSLRQFERNDLLGQVKKTLIDEMLPAESIELEVTESLFSEDNNYHTPILFALRELGIKVAIDDFGTGYSSLQRLKNLPIDNVKIDKCFVDNIEHSPEDVAIVMATILLSKTFKVDLIAEGIETQEQADKLSDLGCFNQQGYLYSRPLRSHDFEAWLADFTLKHKERKILQVVNNS